MQTVLLQQSSESKQKSCCTKQYF